MRFFEYNIFGIYKTTFVLQFRLYIRQKDIDIICIDSSLPIQRIISNTVRTHRKLRDAGVIPDLVVLEGASHGDYLIVQDSPESIASLLDLKLFLKNNMNFDFQ